MFTTKNQMMRVAIVSLFLSTQAFSAQHVDDGVAPIAQAATVVEAARPSCLAEDGKCPAYPLSLEFNAAEILAVITVEHLCADTDMPSEEIDRLGPLLELGSDHDVAAAIANVLLTEPGLQIHALKLGIGMLAAIDTEDAADYLNKLYRSSIAITERIIRRANLRRVDENDLQILIEHQAADIRRHAVQAVQDKQQPIAAKIISMALHDKDPSVSLEAAKVKRIHPH